MTVKELIEWLKGMSQDAEVKLYTETAGEKVTLDAKGDLFMRRIIILSEEDIQKLNNDESVPLRINAEYNNFYNEQILIMTQKSYNEIQDEIFEHQKRGIYHV